MIPIIWSIESWLSNSFLQGLVFIRTGQFSFLFLIILFWLNITMKGVCFAMPAADIASTWSHGGANTEVQQMFLWWYHTPPLGTALPHPPPSPSGKWVPLSPLCSWGTAGGKPGLEKSANGFEKLPWKCWGESDVSITAGFSCVYWEGV